VRDEGVLSVRGARPLELVVHFTSLGFGSDYDACLQPGNQNPVQIVWPGRRSNQFYPKGSGSAAFGSGDPSALHDRLVANPDGSYTLTKPDQAQYVFGPAVGPGGALYLSAAANPAGQQLTFRYPNATASSRGTVVVTGPVSGQARTLAYDAANRLASVGDPLGRQAAFAYTGATAAPSLVQVLDPSGTVVKATRYA
jgi:hypothetical protein